MNFSQENVKGILIKHVHLTRATKDQAEQFKQFLLKDIEQNKSSIIVDLAECEFIDSTFISSLVVGLKAINRSEGKLKIVAVHSDVQSVFELTGMVKVFEIYKSVSDALSNFDLNNPRV